MENNYKILQLIKNTSDEIKAKFKTDGERYINCSILFWAVVELEDGSQEILPVIMEFGKKGLKVVINMNEYIGIVNINS